MQNVKMRPLKRAVVKEEFYAITGNLIEAIILNQMIYWSERISDFDKFIEEERSRQKLYGDSVNDFPLQYGWIHKSSAELKEEIMCSDSPKTIMRRLDNLVSKGFLERRNNPEHPYDRVYQYRVDFLAVIKALSREGYTLEGYKVNLNTEASKPVSGESDKDDLPDKEIPGDNCTHGQDGNVKTKGQNVPLGGQTAPAMGQNDSAIPEITAEITSETISSSSYSPNRGTNGRRSDEDGQEAELNRLYSAMGIERLKRRELVEPMKAVIADLWHTRRVGKSTASRGAVKKALSLLSPEIIEGIFDKFDRQGKKGQIAAPAEYIKALILNAPMDAELMRVSRAQRGADRKDEPSYDIDEYIRLSVMRLNKMNI